MGSTLYDITFSPFLIIQDTSPSMLRGDEETCPLRIAERIVPNLARIGREFPTVDQSTRVGLIEFNTDAHVLLPIGASGLLSQLEERDVKFTADGSTHYGAAFRAARTELEQLPGRLQRHERLSGLKVGIHRPVVFFITDGNPNDDDEERDEQWHRLTDPAFRFAPHFSTCGVGDVAPDKIAKYRNRRGSVLIARDPKDVAASIVDLVELMNGTIIGLGAGMDDEQAPIIDESAIPESFDVLDYDVLS